MKKYLSMEVGVEKLRVLKCRILVGGRRPRMGNKWAINAIAGDIEVQMT